MKDHSWIPEIVGKAAFELLDDVVRPGVSARRQILAWSVLAALLTPQATGAQQMSKLVVPPGCFPELVAERPGSGAEIGGAYRGGFGSLHIKNDSESDAIAVLIDARTRIARRAIYIRRAETGVMSSIPAGEYRVQFQMGDTWLTTNRFCTIVGTSQFDDLLTFAARDDVDAVAYSRYDLTLFPVVFFGNVDPDALPNAPLRLPD
ncbi:MAG: hypothetical protein AB7F99_08945 [Vicinamibacterales bacterium]